MIEVRHVLQKWPEILGVTELKAREAVLGEEDDVGGPRLGLAREVLILDKILLH